VPSSSVRWSPGRGIFSPGRPRDPALPRPRQCQDHLRLGGIGPGGGSGGTGRCRFTRARPLTSHPLHPPRRPRRLLHAPRRPRHLATCRSGLRPACPHLTAGWVRCRGVRCICAGQNDTAGHASHEDQHSLSGIEPFPVPPMHSSPVSHRPDGVNAACYQLYPAEYRVHPKRRPGGMAATPPSERKDKAQPG
jgi:hypothetical protein